MIAMEGEVMSFAPHGVRQVRLDNGHLITVRPYEGVGPQGWSHIGERVGIEMPFKETQGWRFKRRP